MPDRWEILAGLKKLGVRPGIALEAHRSMGALGRVDGGALVMPAFRLSPNLPLTEDDLRMGLTLKIKILPEDAPRTAMGIVADTFRKRPDVPTGEGVFRFSAWGSTRPSTRGGSGT